MTVAIVCDAACDLPVSYISGSGIEILPIYLRFGNQVVTDVRDPTLALRFYRTYIEHKDIDAETTPYTPQETAGFLKRLLPRYEQILCITITRERSQIYGNTQQAAKLLKQAGDPARVHVLDSNSLFAGEAVIVAAAAELAAQGATLEQIMNKIRELSTKVEAYGVMRDLYYLRARARKRGDNSVGLLQYIAGQALDVKPLIHAQGPHSNVIARVRGFDEAVNALFEKAIDAIRHGLSVPVLTMSYAGNPKEVTEFPRYHELAAIAKSHEVQLLIAVMSPTAGVYLGPGAFTFGFLPRITVA